MADLERRITTLELSHKKLQKENTDLRREMESLVVIYDKKRKALIKIQEESASAVSTVKKANERLTHQDHLWKEFMNDRQDDLANRTNQVNSSEDSDEEQNDKRADDDTSMMTTDDKAADAASTDVEPTKGIGLHILKQKEKSDGDAAGSSTANKTETKAHSPKKTTHTIFLRSTCGDNRRGCSFHKQQSEEFAKAVLRNCEDGLKQMECPPPPKGRGVVADKVFSRDDFVVEYRGQLVDQAAAKLREAAYAEDNAVGCYMYHFEFKGKRYCVDATAETPHLGRLVNHSAKKPNLIAKVIDVNGTPRLILIAHRSIAVGDELLYDYGDRSAAAIAANPWLKS